VDVDEVALRIEAALSSHILEGSVCPTYRQKEWTCGNTQPKSLPPSQTQRSPTDTTQYTSASIQRLYIERSRVAFEGRGRGAGGATIRFPEVEDIVTGAKDGKGGCPGVGSMNEFERGRLNGSIVIEAAESSGNTGGLRGGFAVHSNGVASREERESIALSPDLASFPCAPEKNKESLSNLRLSLIEFLSFRSDGSTSKDFPNSMS